MAEKQDYTKDIGETGPAGAVGPEGPGGETGPEGPPGTTTWDGITDKPTSFTPAAHGATHENTAADEISVENLSGELADEQKSSWAKVSGKPTSFNPSAHSSDHENGGGDELSVEDLSGKLADEQDAGLIKGVIIDDSAKADGKLLGYVSATGNVEYI